MASFDLTSVEARILGCLIEKERITPENYPLSLNSLTAACNQSTNRDPVTAYDEKTIDAGLYSLRQRKLATAIFAAGSRVQKYRHTLLDHFELQRGEVALLCVLLLRGPQTPGELRARSERMGGFGSLDEIETCLAELAKGDTPLVKMLPARPGQKEKRYVQLLSATPDGMEAPESAPVESPPEQPSRMDALEREVAALRSELERLREEFTEFRGLRPLL